MKTKLVIVALVSFLGLVGLVAYAQDGGAVFKSVISVLVSSGSSESRGGGLSGVYVPPSN